ncbi:MAG: nucleoside triphosphate pyrophosphohydrolase [Acidobacteria bacterium]|nr:nucleoside triphosphate pyrophosphohydrolase [Acidobacteriota bacterium]
MKEGSGVNDSPGHTEHYFHRLMELMDVLRSEKGCPWDREQTPETLKPMLIEEAYEVLEALDGDDSDRLCEELGDLLFQVIFHSRIAKENGRFDADEVCRRVYLKMVRRHPHVFGSASYESSADLLRHWEDIKAAEKKTAGQMHDRKSLLDGIPAKLPALYTAYQISAKAARVGFDWPELEGIREKLLEEFDELQEALRENQPDKIREEVGDLLFAALNVARYLQVDPETSLSRANEKFTRRFRALEKHFAEQGRHLRDVSLEEMEAAWQRLQMPA